jgi:uncharacterized protein YeaO (DUF488 family)
MFQIKRVREEPKRTDGVRFLAERLWPRGVKKASLKLDAWLKEVGPSTELRKWFNHDPAKWKEFQKRYFAELDENPETWQPILDAAKAGTVTLLFSSHDAEKNNVTALKTYLERKLIRNKPRSVTSAKKK